MKLSDWDMKGFKIQSRTALVPLTKNTANINQKHINHWGNFCKDEHALNFYPEHILYPQPKKKS